MFDKCIALYDQLSKEAETMDHWNILVVDDDMDVHVATRFCLANAVVAQRKVHLIDVYSRREAIDFLKMNDRIDLILLDVVMETQDAGLEVARWLHEDAQLAVIPKIILRTGQPGFNQLSDMVEANYINAVLQKSSTTYASLVNTVTQLLLETCTDVPQHAKRIKAC